MEEPACAPAGEGVFCEAHDGVGGRWCSDDEGAIGEFDVFEVVEGDGPACEGEEGPDPVGGVGQRWGAGGVGDDEASRVEGCADGGGAEEDEDGGDEGCGVWGLEGADEGDGADGQEDGVEGVAQGGVEDGWGGLAGQLDAVGRQDCDAPGVDAVCGLEREGVGEEVGIKPTAPSSESCGEDEAEDGAQGRCGQADDEEEPADGEEGVAQERGAAGGACDNEREPEEGEVEEEDAHGATGVEFGEFVIEGGKVALVQGWGTHGTRVSGGPGSLKGELSRVAVVYRAGFGDGHGDSAGAVRGSGV